MTKLINAKISQAQSMLLDCVTKSQKKSQSDIIRSAIINFKKNVAVELVNNYDFDSTDKLVSKRVNCRIPDDYYEQLEVIAKEYNLGISETLRIALNMYFYYLIKSDSVVIAELENDFRQLLEKAGINF